MRSLVAIAIVLAGWILLDRELHAGREERSSTWLAVALLLAGSSVCIYSFVRQWQVWRAAALARLFALFLVGGPLLLLAVVVEWQFRSTGSAGGGSIALRCLVHGVALTALCLGSSGIRSTRTVQAPHSN
jgi:hypothetical protein